MVSALKKITFLTILFLISCRSDSGNLEVVCNLPKPLKEISGIQTMNNSKFIWAVNDGGNKNRIYGLNSKGKIKKVVVVNAENNDWEDLTADDKGNLYIGDFGNNHNKRKNLSILKIKSKDLKNKNKVDVERIQFYFPNQKKFPPKRKEKYFDTESFFFFNDSLYLFTRSRVKGKYGKTSLYKIPAIKGNHSAKFISEFTFCKDLKCSITSADISSDKKKVVLLTSDTVLQFTDFKNDDFFKGKVTHFPLGHVSQKESVTFKNDSTLYIADELFLGIGRKLYKFKL